MTHSILGGIESTVKTMERVSGFDVNYYARINFISLIKMVDALGSVEVNSIESFYAQGYNFKKGINHVNGKEILAFARERYHVTGGSYMPNRKLYNMIPNQKNVEENKRYIQQALKGQSIQ